MRKSLRILTIVAVLLVGASLVSGGLFALVVVSRKRPSPVASTTHRSIGRGACISCHAPIAAEWRRSYHHRSLTGPYWNDVRRLGYAKVFERVRKACVNCHAPANVLDLVPSALATGDRLGVECTPNLLHEPAGAFPDARADDAELGVDCTSCHVSRSGIAGAGRRPAGEHETFADRRFRDPGVTSEALCSVCHRATVEAWKRTPLPVRGVSCLTCHMPEIEAANVAGGPIRTRRSHAFPGDKEAPMLEKAVHAALTITPDRKARFEIENDRVGHDLPSGGNWVSVRLRAVNAAGSVAREKIATFGKDEALILDFWPFNRDTRIPFGEKRQLLLPLPEGKGTVEAVVRYHDWMKTKQTIATLRREY